MRTGAFVVMMRPHWNYNRGGIFGEYRLDNISRRDSAAVRLQAISTGSVGILLIR